MFRKEGGTPRPPAEAIEPFDIASAHEAGARIGVIHERLTVDEVFRAREFPWRRKLTGWLEDCYFARIPTLAIARCATHELKYAV